MKILVIDDCYPAPDKLYSDVFVHTRVKAYSAHCDDITVVASLWQEGPDYQFDGVDVLRAGSHDRLEKIARGIQPDVILVHFATFHVIRKLIERMDAPYVIWSHGFDAVGWWRRLYQWRPLGSFARYLAGNMAQRYFYRRLLRRANRTHRIAMVFVSEWLKRVAQQDALAKLNKAHVIPNPIDTHRFVPRTRVADDRKKWLILRPVSKSGFDILTDALVELSTELWFEEIDILFVGEGVTGSRFDRKLGMLPNVRLESRSITQDEIVELHMHYGVFLSPTRQDSHGVSMCEAMASGMVVVSCANSAIPEFVEHGVTGLLSQTQARSFAEQLRYLYRNPENYLVMAKGAPVSISQSCGIDQVIPRELEVIHSVAGVRKSGRA